MGLYGFRNWPDRTCAIVDGQTNPVTYGDLADFTEWISVVCSGRSLALVLTRNTAGGITASFSLIEAGMVPLLVDDGLPTKSVERLIAAYCPEILAVPSQYDMDHLGYRRRGQLLDYSLWTRPTPDVLALHPDLALLLMTSGSTGNPKVVRLSYANIDANGKAIVNYLGLSASERPITSLPLSYTYGFSVANSHLMVGATIMATENSILERQFWNFFRESEATSLAGVPYTYEMLHRLKFTQMALPSLKTMTQAGGRLAESLVVEFADFAHRISADFYVMYGQTEATARISYLPPDKVLEKPRSIGVPIPGGRMTVIDEQGHEIMSPDVVGELVYAGPNVAMGYAVGRSDLATGDLWHGILRTGDIARQDSDGYFYLVGRVARDAKLFGKRVNLDDLEAIARAYSHRVACTAGENRVDVWVETRNVEGPIRNLLSGETGIHHSAFNVIQIDALPVASSGKVDYRALTASEE